MTIVFTFASPAFMVMANDSAVTKSFSDGLVEYETGRKFFAADGIGVVTMWGARNRNRLLSKLDQTEVTAQTHHPELLAQIVQRYLMEEYAPHDGTLEDTGYHVGGFMHDGTPRLFHIYWNAQGSGNAARNWGTYCVELHHPPEGVAGFLYNGRHDIVNSLMQPFMAELNRGKQTAFPLTPFGMCRLAHFILRVGAELTKEVSRPFFIHLLAPSRRCITIPADKETPFSDAELAKFVEKVGLQQ